MGTLICSVGGLWYKYERRCAHSPSWLFMLSPLQSSETGASQEERKCARSMFIKWYKETCVCSGMFLFFECGIIKSAMLHIFMHICSDNVLFSALCELNNYSVFSVMRPNYRPCVKSPNLWKYKFSNNFAWGRYGLSRYFHFLKCVYWWHFEKNKNNNNTD